MKENTIPPATVNRLPTYLQCLEKLPRGQRTVSSQQLAEMANVNAAKVRKDLSHLGSHGQRGVGYDVEHLGFQIRNELGLDRDWHVAIVGAGNLGSALAGYRGFGQRRFQIQALYDVDRRKVGRKIGNLYVRHLDDFAADAAGDGIDIVIVATPAGVAQDVADLVAASGVKSILNFAPAVIHPPEGVDVRAVDLSTELQILSFYMAQR